MRANVETSKRRNVEIFWRRVGMHASETGHSCWGAGFLAAILLLGGCKSKQSVQPPEQTFQPPSYAQLAAVHNERVAKLQRFYATGVIELRWRDDRGKHFEQGNLELWIQQPRRTALRVEKVGQVFLWLGSNDEQYWLFNLLGEDKVLHLRRHDQPEQLANEALAIQPLALLDLMGIAPIPAEDDTATVEYSKDHDGWAFRTQGAGGPVRLVLHRQTLHPVRVETLDSNGKILVGSSLNRYESVTQQGMSVLAFPKMAQLIDLSIAEPSPTAGAAAQAAAPSFTGEVKIAIGSATATVEEAQLQRVFDLDRLTRALQPTRVQAQ